MDCGLLVPSIAVILLSLWMFRVWLRGPMYKGKGLMEGKIVLITGGNSGIGKETAKDLALRGAQVVILCRDLKKAQNAADDIKRTTGKEILIEKCDLASFQSIKECAAIVKEKYPKIDVLINNAGIMACPQWDTKDGFEMHFGTNHLGHFLLTTLLLENLKAAAPSRVVNVSSLAHTKMCRGKMHWDDINMRKNYDPNKAYGQSKLANILFTKQLAKLVRKDGITTYALHPGVIATNIGHHLEDKYGGMIYNFIKKGVIFFGKTPVLGAQTTIYCAVDEDLANETGMYYSDCKQVNSSKDSMNEEYAERLWNLSMKFTGLQTDKA